MLEQPYKSTLLKRIEAHEARQRREERRAWRLVALMVILYLIGAYFETAHMI